MKKFALLLVALCLVVGMNSTTLAQTTYSVVIKDLVSPYPVSGLVDQVFIQLWDENGVRDDRIMIETNPLLTPGLYEFTTELVPGVDFIEWRVNIADPDDFSFPYAEPNPTSFKSPGTYHFEWIIVDNRP